jgi:hypothetical protein
VLTGPTVRSGPSASCQTDQKGRAVTNETVRYVSAKDTAKLIRQALRAGWPSVKFSVRTHTYAGGASVDVSWTDGPTEAEVRATTDRYRGASFDGMRDLKEFHDTVLVDDQGRPELVHFGAHFVGTERRVSDGLVAAGTALLSAWNRRGYDRHGGQCRYCGDWQPADHLWWVARGSRGSVDFCCTAEHAARHEIRHGHVRPSSR